MDGINNGGAAQIPQKVKLTAKEFAAKFSTKRECFTFLTIDCKAYLPDYDTLTIYFLKDLIAGKKKFIRSHQCKHLQIPQYKSLKVERLYEFIGQYPETYAYYPVKQEIRKLPKQWIANVAYSILEDEFSDWVKEQIEARNEHVAQKGNLYIELDPDVAAAFAASTAVSLQKGSSVNMLKVGSKRRRTQAQVKADKEEAMLKEQDIQDRLARLAQAEAKLAEFDRMAAENQHAQDIISQLHAAGQVDIDDQGRVSPSK